MTLYHWVIENNKTKERQIIITKSGCAPVRAGYTTVCCCGKHETPEKIEFDTQSTAERLVALALPNGNTPQKLVDETIHETEKALYYLKAIAGNEYNDEYFRTFVKVLKSICIYDYLED